MKEKCADIFRNFFEQTDDELQKVHQKMHNYTEYKFKRFKLN